MYKTDYLQNGAKRRDVYVDVVYHISPRAALDLMLGVLLLGVLLLVLGLVAAASNPWNPPLYIYFIQRIDGHMAIKYIRL